MQAGEAAWKGPKETSTSCLNRLTRHRRSEPKNISSLLRITKSLGIRAYSPVQLIPNHHAARHQRRRGNLLAHSPVYSA